MGKQQASFCSPDNPSSRDPTAPGGIISLLKNTLKKLCPTICGVKQSDRIMLPVDDCIAEGISSPIAAHILDFCDDGLDDDLFAAVASTSDPFAASSEDVSSSSTATPPLCSYSDDITAAAATAFSPLPCFDSTLSALLEEEQNPDPDTQLLIPPISETLTASGCCQAANGESSVKQFSQIPLPESIGEPLPAMQMGMTAPMLGFNEECFTAALAAGYLSLDGALYQQTGAMIPSCNAEASQVGFFNGSSGNSNGMVVLDMNEIGEYQRMMEGEGLTRTYGGTDSMQGAYNNTSEVQMEESNQHLVNGCNGSPQTLPPTEISGLEDPTFKVARLSAEQRKEKIDRYIKKRNERNFSKKIKYACRKTLADSRPRVRGRFAKNEELCEATRSSYQNHEQYEQSGAADEEDMLDSSDILAHLSGINSYNYKYNCTTESWI